jgi:hypothetical protein
MRDMTEMDRGRLEEALATLGAVLEARGKRFEVVAIGGSSLLLLGLLARPTKDLDLVARIDAGRYLSPDPLPAALAEAGEDVARTLGLAPDWLNAGPASLLALGLPDGFEGRLTTFRHGGLVVHVAGRRDQVFFKLYAAVDQWPASKHQADLQGLRPTREELLSAARWARTHDPSEPFREGLATVLAELGVEAPDGLI